MTTRGDNLTATFLLLAQITAGLAVIVILVLLVVSEERVLRNSHAPFLEQFPAAGNDKREAHLWGDADKRKVTGESR